MCVPRPPAEHTPAALADFMAVGAVSAGSRGAHTQADLAEEVVAGLTAAVLEEEAERVVLIAVAMEVAEEDSMPVDSAAVLAAVNLVEVGSVAAARVAGSLEVVGSIAVERASLAIAAASLAALERVVSRAAILPTPPVVDNSTTFLACPRTKAFTV